MKKALFAIALFVIASAPAKAADAEYKHEIIASQTSAALTLGTGSDAFGLRAGWLYNLGGGLQVGLLEASINWTLSGTKDFQYMALPGIAWNSSTNLSDAWFVQAGAGVTEVANTAQFTFGGDVGKRIGIVPNVTWKPGIGVRKISSSDWVVRLNIVNFAVLL